MKKILAIGEALIDFLANDVGSSVKDVKSFTPKVGGAPCNVCGAVSKLGVPSGIITMLGMDQFGDKIIEYLMTNSIMNDWDNDNMTLYARCIFMRSVFRLNVNLNTQFI